MHNSKITLLLIFGCILISTSGCSLIGFASLKQAEAEQKKLQQREKVIEDRSEFEMADIYFNNWSMKEIETTRGERIEMNYRGRVFLDVESQERDSVHSIPLLYNRIAFFSDNEMIHEGNLNRMKRGENGVWIFELFHPDTTLSSIQVDSLEVIVEKELRFDVLRYGLEKFEDLPFEKTSEEYGYDRYRLSVDNIKGWGLGGATSDSTYRVLPLKDIDNITFKSGPVPPTGMGAAIFMGFAVVTDIVILATLGLIWLL